MSVTATVAVPTPEELASLRNEHGYTQYDVADIGGIHQSSVSRYERGLETAIDDETLKQIAVKIRPDLVERPVVQLADPPLGDGLRQWRKSLGISQYELADLVGCSQPYIANIEAGRENPSESMKTRIAGVISRAEFGREEVVFTDDTASVTLVRSDD